MPTFDLTACLRGDKAAWDAFVDRFGRVIYAAVSRTLRTHASRAREEVARDVTQDVFVRLIRHDYRLLRTYDPARAALTTWLTIVARSTTLDYLRRKRLATIPLEDAPPAAEPVETAPAHHEGLELPEHILSPRQRLVMRLLFDDEKSVTEAAEILSVTPQTIRSTKHKALERLRKHLNPP